MLVFLNFILSAFLFSIFSVTRAEDATVPSAMTSPVTPSKAPTDEPLTCPEGWLNADFLGCFYFDNSKPDRHLNWVEAVDVCESLGGYLAEIQTEKQADFIASVAMLEESLTGIDTWWIGLTDMGHEGRWSWSHSSEDSEYTNWSPGHPNQDSQNTDDCVSISLTEDFAWRDVSCHDKVTAAPICQKDVNMDTTTQIPTTTSFPGCPSGLTEYNNSCWKFIYSSNSNSWQNAQDYCESLGANLASIHSEAEFLFLQDLVASYSGSFWLGGTDAAVEGSWLWSDGSDWDYINWMPGQPDSGTSQNCLAMDTGEGGSWRDLGCITDNVYSFICRMF